MPNLKAKLAAGVAVTSVVAGGLVAWPLWQKARQEAQMREEIIEATHALGDEIRRGYPGCQCP